LQEEEATLPRVMPGNVSVKQNAGDIFEVTFRPGRRNAKPDPQATVRDLGVIFYRAVTGQPPTKTGAKLDQELVDLVPAEATVVDRLSALVRALLATDP